MYPIIEVPSESAQLLEQLGTKSKFWFKKDGRPCLFKEGRPNTGEDWAEKIVSEICRTLEVPCAKYNFGKYRERYGVISESIVPQSGRLILGNELISRLERDYDATKKYHQSDYTASRAFAILRDKQICLPIGYDLPDGIATAADVFVGYLMIDALVGNQDRHHENWGLLVLPPLQIHLAPTFDHASSLGRNESDDKMSDILNTRDTRRHITSYVAKAKSAFYSPHSKTARMTTIEAFEEAKKFHPIAAQIWLKKLSLLSLDDVSSIIEKVPGMLMTPVARTFAHTMIGINQQRLLKILGE